MRAFVLRSYGSPDVLDLTDIDKPVPGDDEVLVRVRGTSVNPYDWHNMRGEAYIGRLMGGLGLRNPKLSILGADMAGQVEAVGKDVTEFRPGDEVFAVLRQGGFAEYVCVQEGELAPKPKNLSFEQAAAVPMAANTALLGLRDEGRIQPGQKVLINGASGGVGTFAVQIAKSFGADVTGVCSTRNLDMVRSLGADHVIDYTKEDFTKGAQRYDVILDNVGTQPLSGFRRALKAQGICVMIGGGGPNDGGLIGPMARPIKTMLMSPFISQKMGMMLAEIHQDDLTKMSELMQAGKVTPVIDRTYPLSQIREAMKYLEAGHARGKVILTVEQENKT
jgi:NADPH:quinone reductase-like Zn-dependent oxidoreductase